MRRLVMYASFGMDHVQINMVLPFYALRYADYVVQ